MDALWRKIRWLAAISCIHLIVGCSPPGGSSDPDAEDSPTTEPAEPVMPIVTTAPATRSAEPVTMTIDDQLYEFPSARLILENFDHQLIATLFTNDPPNAGELDYAGHGFRMEFPLEVPAGQTLAGANWEFDSPNMEWVDTIDGISLHGGRELLQPFVVRIEFLDSVSPVQVKIDGTFLLFREAPNAEGNNREANNRETNNREALVSAPPKKVSIHARFVADVSVNTSPANAPSE
jgi:hypothetical protein